MSIQKNGFTLIELLVVIAIVGILAAAVLIAINPLQKINQANDADVKTDVGQIASAAQTYYTFNLSYPVTGAPGMAALVTAKEMAGNPSLTGPSGYTYTYTSLPAGCTGNATTPCTSFSMSVTLKAPTNTSMNMWCFRSSLGTTVEATNCPTP